MAKRAVPHNCAARADVGRAQDPPHNCAEGPAPQSKAGRAILAKKAVFTRLVPSEADFYKLPRSKRESRAAWAAGFPHSHELYR